MDPVRGKIVCLARDQLGIRWRHQGRDPKAGLDCAGLVLWVGWELGLVPRDFDVQGYRREPDGKSLAQALASHAVQKAWPNWLPGDIVLLRDIATLMPCHMGILAERPGSTYPNLIHSWSKGRRQIIEVRFDDDWMGRLVGLYYYKEVT